MDGLRVVLAAECGVAFVTLLVLAGTHTGIDFPLPVFSEVFLPACGCLMIASVLRMQKLVLLSQGVALTFLGGLCSGVVAVASLRRGAAFSDWFLDGADHLIGLHTDRLIILMAPYDGLHHVLTIAYNLTHFMIPVCLTALALRGNATELYRMVFVFSVGGLVCCLCNLFVPGIGTVAYHHIPAEVMAHYPVGAGTYFLKDLLAWHSGTRNVVTLETMSGVVAFPSFHMVMALTELRALRFGKVGNALVFAAFCLVAISIVPVGGHYGMDAAGGVAVYCLVRALAVRLIRDVKAPATKPAAESLLV